LEKQNLSEVDVVKRREIEKRQVFNKQAMKMCRGNFPSYTIKHCWFSLNSKVEQIMRTQLGKHHSGKVQRHSSNLDILHLKLADQGFWLIVKRLRKVQLLPHFSNGCLLRSVSLFAISHPMGCSSTAIIIS